MSKPHFEFSAQSEQPISCNSIFTVSPNLGIATSRMPTLQNGLMSQIVYQKSKLPVETAIVCSLYIISEIWFSSLWHWYILMISSWQVLVKKKQQVDFSSVVVALQNTEKSHHKIQCIMLPFYPRSSSEMSCLLLTKPPSRPAVCNTRVIAWAFATVQMPGLPKRASRGNPSYKLWC